MKYKSFLIVSVCFAITCCSNNTTKDTSAEKKVEDISVADKENVPTDPNSIVGKWALTLEADDENGNKMLDEEERKKGKPNTYYYQFKADGTCIIFQNEKGHYEIKESGGVKKLYTYYDEGQNKGPEAQYFIKSVNKDELVLLEGMGELVFWVFKRQ